MQAMMSVSNVSAGAAGSGYYKAEGYYTAGTPEAEAAAQWFGKAADELAAAGQTQLSGTVDDKVFSEILDGRTPPTQKDDEGNWKPGQVMGRTVDGEREHRPGLDLTFSASKTVSIMALVGKDERVVAAHDAAVRAALTYVEENMAATRRAGPDGRMEVITGGKLIAGLFRHDTSRALDPQLHTHAVIVNMVLGEDGKFTALHNNAIFTAVKVGSEIYRNELAKNLTELGYTIERRGKDGIVEIEGVPAKLVETYSKRSEAIKTALDARGVEDSAENRAAAALATRVKKNGNLDRDALHREWSEEAFQAGYSAEMLQGLRDKSIRDLALRLPGVTRYGQTSTFSMQEARQALQFAVSHVSERQSVYTENDLLKTALPRLERAGIAELKAAVQEQVKEKTLLNAGTDAKNQKLFTDKETLATEREAISEYRAAVREAKLSLGAYESNRKSAESTLYQQLSRTSLTEGQRDAVTIALTGTSRFVGVQGSAGTGKTFMVETLNRYAQRAGYELEGLAPSGRAVEALKEAIPEAKTLQSYLVQIKAGGTPGDEDKSKRILVVDEAGMLSAADTRDLMKFANKAGYARVVLVGDTKQLDAVDAGQSFAQLQKAGMPTALMMDIQRQRSETGTEAVLHAIKGEIREAMAKISSVQSVEGSNTLLPEAVANRWLQLTQAQRDKTGIVVLTNSARQTVNKHIRETLKDESRIGRQDHTLQTLRDQGMTRAEKADARSYAVGDIVLPVAKAPRDGLEKDVKYRVAQIDKRANSISLLDERSGELHSVALRQNDKSAHNLRVYKEETRDFSINDQVKLTIADKSNGIINGARARIEAISDQAMTLLLDDGRKATLPRDGLTVKGMDHAYAATAHDFQGSTVDRIIIGMSATEGLSTQKSFYVNISRMRDEAVLLTTNVADLAKRLEDNTGQRPAALETWLKAERERFTSPKYSPDASSDAARAKRTVELQKVATDTLAHIDATLARDRENAAELKFGPKDQPDVSDKHLALISNRDDIGPDNTPADFEKSRKALEQAQKQKIMEGPTR
jgi:conjugative relaxase-like TrwC/TraI family protein